ncbi:hypothetical protein RJB80_05105 [Staphylococcus hominis]|uniref:hypothetical protein n=1 Tax=Staphylococcus hominis TaxID=1290 RepID=UPI00287990A5|nr:hypothetical protein [Staphylococcus hominis]MDS3887052.1 hypothetical protein [Staphylococcus hominis]MDS3887117.1 hypothetical protein [Staphylococcus hominis]
MAEPTLDELVAFMKKHGVEKVDSITDEKSAIKHFRAASRVYKEERDSFRKQRDELINDMAKVKRKAEAFDEIKEMINWFEDIRPCEFETQVVRVRRIIYDLERGAFNSHPNNVKLQREIEEEQ